MTGGQPRASSLGSMSVSVAVAGASGYAGGELLRLLAQHPTLEVATVTAHSNAGQPLLAVHPHLRSLAGLSFVETTAAQLQGHDVVFLALPHGQSAALAAQLGDDVLVVDCGADHRLASEADWQAFYGDGWGGSWPYGMPELPVGDGLQRRNLRGVRRIAVPGCNVTAVTLALAPGVQAGLVDARDVVPPHDDPDHLRAAHRQLDLVRPQHDRVLRRPAHVRQQPAAEGEGDDPDQGRREPFAVPQEPHRERHRAAAQREQDQQHREVVGDGRQALATAHAAAHRGPHHARPVRLPGSAAAAHGGQSAGCSGRRRARRCCRSRGETASNLVLGGLGARRFRSRRGASAWRR